MVSRQRERERECERERETERDVSLGQFALTHRNAQVGERCQTTEREGARDRFVGGGRERGKKERQTEQREDKRSILTVKI